MKKQQVTILVIMTFISILYNMAHPVTPSLVKALGFSPSFFGVVFATMSFATFIMSPVWGRLSDQNGRKKFMVMAPIGYGMAQLGFGLSSHQALILMFRLMAGSISCASFVCGMAYLVDITKRENRSKIMAFYTALTGFGATLGYLFGGIIGNQRYQIAFITQAILCLIMALVIVLVLKEHHEPKQLCVKRHLIHDLKQYHHTLVPFILFIIILTSFMAKGFDIGFNAYIEYSLELGSKVLGFAMAIGGLIGLFTNFIIFPLLKRRFNDLNLLVTSIIIMMTTLVLMTLVKQMPYQIIALGFFFSALALYKPLLQAMLSKIGHQHGEIMGLNNAANAIGMVIGSLYVGFAFERSFNLAVYSVVFVGLVVILFLLSKVNQLREIGR
jgi:MFS transporter, DHA1 family, multidrug resistance protein